jgi:hypothetical protein
MAAARFRFEFPVKILSPTLIELSSVKLTSML